MPNDSLSANQMLENSNDRELTSNQRPSIDNDRTTTALSQAFVDALLLIYQTHLQQKALPEHQVISKHQYEII